MELDDFTFRKLKEYVDQELGFSISYYNEEYLKRRIKSRMRRTDCDDLDAYYTHVRETPDEQEKLLRSFSINVTGFFRNQDVWEGIQEIMREKTPDADEFRIWSAGCADGREPYSAALLALSDPEINADAVKVFGTDINDEALEKARDGVYRKTITNDIDSQLEYLINPTEKCVEWDDDRAIIGDEVKKKVTFKRHDLIRDDPLHRFDLVMCRNVLIYLKRTHEKDIFETISSATKENGYIVIGKAETLPSSLDPVFNSVDSRLRIYQYTG